MSTLPLTHHDIVALLAPFTAAGWRIDLGASDRGARRLVFRAADTTPAEAGSATAAPGAHAEAPRAGLQAGLRLGVQAELHAEVRADGRFTLTRLLVHADGRQAELMARGHDAAALLAAMAAVPAERQFADGPGWALSRSFALEDVGPGGRARTDFARGEARLDGLTLGFTVPATRVRAADIVLLPAADRPRPALPADLLAVLGWSWARLVPDRLGWKSRLRLPRGEARRHAGAEAALDRATAHMARTLAAGPAQWHPRHRGARWGVFLRRGIPTFTAGLLIGGLIVAAQFDLDVDRAPGLWMALYHVPTLLIAMSFMLQELPRFEIPPLPRRLRAAGWWETGAAGHGPAGATSPANPAA